MPDGAHAHHLRVARTARYYTLSGRGGDRTSPRVIWFVLHGYGQLAGQFVRYFADLADAESLIVAPEAMNRFYLVRPETAPARERPVGATWMTREDRESEIADYVEYLDALFNEVAAPAAQAGARVEVLGFSQGTATATRWVAYGQSRVDRLTLWGGLMPPESELHRGPDLLRGTRLLFVLGTRDEHIDDAALGAERARLDAAGIEHDVIRFDGGHKISRAVFPQLRTAPSP